MGQGRGGSGCRHRSLRPLNQGGPAKSRRLDGLCQAECKGDKFCHVIPAKGRETPGAHSDAYFWVADAIALAKEFKQRGATFLSEPTYQQIYNGRDFQVRDCDGRILCFGQLLDD